MNTFKVSTHVFFAIACAFAVHSKSFAEPANLSQLKTEMKAYHESGAYQKELSQAIAPATRYIIERAKSNEKRAKPQKLAIVLDIDETSVTNYSHMTARDFADNKEDVHRSMLAANAPAIKPMLALYNTALQKHVAVFFVTGRRESLEKVTGQNLQFAGFNKWAGLYMRPNHYKHPTIATFKTKTRQAITEKGYTIIASLGDQQSDLTGGYAEKTYKLPNPYYYIP